MNLDKKIKMLYEKDSNEAYRNLLELEELSDKNNALYSYFDTFLQMIESEDYAIRVRGYRLICKLAMWDEDNKLDGVIDYLLLHIFDDKPTAIRQKLISLKNLVKYKNKFNSKIKKSILKLDYSSFKDTMQPLIKRDIDELIKLIG